MKIRLIAAGALLSLASCSMEKKVEPARVWLTASSLEQPNVAYTRKPIFVARETSLGMWEWRPEKAVFRRVNVDQLAGELAAAKLLTPEPMILFSFAYHADSAELDDLKSRLADAASCSSSNPCIEGTPEQLR